MRKVLDHRPSPSMVVAVIALIVAMSGSAVAATHLVRGDKLIKKRSLSGNRLRNHTLTGTQINLKKLGKVPSAKQADSAVSALSAVNATNATDAVSATDAAQLGGAPASSYLTTASRLGTSGIAKVQGTASGTTVTLFSHGPFTVTMTCTTSGTNTNYSINATSSESNSVIDARTAVAANAEVNLDAGTSTPNAQVGGGTVQSFEAPSGAAIVFTGAWGTNSAGVTNGCWANLVGLA